MSDLSYGVLLKAATSRLVQALGDDGTRNTEARLLLQHASGFDRAGLLVRDADIADASVIDAYQTMIAQREAGKPVFRIIGGREFHGLNLQLSSETLEPRDDTEALVDGVLSMIKDRTASVRFADLGTGSGAIALALLSELPNASCVASDVSQDALKTAQRNAVLCGFGDRFEPVHGSWFEPLCGKFDFLVSNPPYIPSRTVDSLDREVLAHDPRAALDGGEDGLDAYRVLLRDGAAFVDNGGFLAVEIGYDQRESVPLLGLEHGWTLALALQDLGERERALVFTRP
ncbi:peptide chain release factor N(5)-glutamine methyltransferase [Pseudahrensia aquimaris]|uniref:Release factor glutamine methyltransferase n=1 Tax=Pseudahrensia aquimaris TaxID=744461 RepID=A0ABW3FDQ4_9HYPH